MANSLKRLALGRPPQEIAMHCCDHQNKQMSSPELDRRGFLQYAGQLTIGSAAAAVLAPHAAGDDNGKLKRTETPQAESLVKLLFESLSPKQRETVCFDWDFEHDERGLLRTRIENNWLVTDPTINSDFYNSDQRALVRQIFESIIHPDWHERFYKEQKDDSGGFGQHNSIAIFGRPGEGKSEFVLTGRHMTLRCDGDSADHVAFGGPIFYGHAAQSFDEEPHHPGNVFWSQAMEANRLYEALDGKQRKLALVKTAPYEGDVQFRGRKARFDGIPISELTGDQRSRVQEVLAKLIEPYRQSDQDEVVACIKKQGGIDACSLAFYEEDDLGKDRVWDIWRLEGPSFVWHYRGAPHVHVWVNVADNPNVELNTM